MGPCGSCASVHPNYHPLHTARALLMAGAPGTGKTVGSFGFFGGTLTDLKFWRENERVMKKKLRRLQIYQTNKWDGQFGAFSPWVLYIDFWRQKIFSAKTRPWFSWPIPGPGFGSCTRAGIEGWQLGHSTHPRVSQRHCGIFGPILMSISKDEKYQYWWLWSYDWLWLYYIYTYICTYVTYVWLRQLKNASQLRHASLTWLTCHELEFSGAQKLQVPFCPMVGSEVYSSEVWGPRVAGSCSFRPVFFTSW